MRKAETLMKGLYIVVALMLVSASAAHSVSASEVGGDATVLLREGTPIILKLTEEISSETHHVGDVVHLAVARDVKVDRYTVIAVDTPATGEITMAEARSLGGQKGRVAFTVFSTTAVDGNRIPLRMSLTRAGRGKEALALGGGVLLCPLLILMRGEEAVFLVGTEVKAYVQNNTDVDITFSLGALAR